MRGLRFIKRSFWNESRMRNVHNGLDPNQALAICGVGGRPFEEPLRFDLERELPGASTPV